MKYPIKILESTANIFRVLSELPEQERIEIINQIRLQLHEYSPFKNEPVDCVQWIPNSLVVANDYNPNTVDPPEMKLLELSLYEDGFTQPKSEAYEKFKQLKKLKKI